MTQVRNVANFSMAEPNELTGLNDGLAEPVIQSGSSKRLEDIIDASLELHGNRPCYWWNGEWHNCGDFLRTADACTKTLQKSGFSQGQRLAAMLPNGPMTLALALSVWRLGGVFCPLNENAGEAYLTKTLSLLKPFTVVASDSVKGTLVDAVKAAGYTCSIMSQDEPAPEFSGTLMEPERDLAVIFSTSGTTGDPKAVPLTHENIIDQCHEILEAVPTVNAHDKLLSVLPNFHAFGFIICSVLPLFVGASEVIVPGFMPPQNVIHAILAAQPTIIALVPTMLGFLVSLIERGKIKIENGPRLIVIGGDRYNPKMEPRVKAAFGTGVMEGYGITECSPVLAVNRLETGARLGTVGEALPNFELQLRSEDGKILSDDATEGVLWTKGPSVTPGYYHAPELNSERFDDGWFNTGDFVQLDGRYIKILDRVTDIIIVGGFNVYPQEVEAVLSEHPAVQTAVVVGTPNKISGEVPKAFIIKHEGAEVSGADIIRFCKEQMSHYKVPREVEFVTELPLSPAGKVLRRVLREKERAQNQDA